MPELHYHSSIQEHLRALAGFDESVGPSELISGWFNDLYFPAEESCPAGYPLEPWSRGQREWRECFSASELSALADFHGVFSLHVDDLSQDWTLWQQDAGWLAIRDAARVAIDRFGSAA